MPEPADTQLHVLHTLSRIVSSGVSLERMLRELIHAAAEFTGCDACLIYLPDPVTGDIVLRASQLPHAAEIGTVRMRPGEGVTGWVAEHNAVVVLSSNAGSDERFKRFPSLVEDTFEAFASVPLVSGGEGIGVLNVHHRNAHAHTPEEIALLTFLGEQMGGAIARSRLEEQNARLQEEATEMKRQLETRKLVERAKGILQRRHQLSEEEAYLRLRNESRRSRRPMREVAEAIIAAEIEAQGSRPGEQPRSL